MKIIFNFVLYCLVSRSALFNTITLIHIFDTKHTGGLEHRKYESKATSRAVLKSKEQISLGRDVLHVGNKYRYYVAKTSSSSQLDGTETVIVSKHDTVVVANSEHRIPKCIRSCFVESDNIIWRGTKSAG